MKVIWADFNARTADGMVRLSTVGSLASLRDTPVEIGEIVELSDGEIRMRARILIRDTELLGEALHGGEHS